MSVLDAVKRGVAGFATVAGKGYEGLGQDQQINAASVIAAAKARRDAENDRVTNLVKQKDLARMQPGDPGYGAYQAGVIRTTGPAETQQVVGRINATAQPNADAKALDIARTAQPLADAERLKIETTDPAAAAAAGHSAAAVAANTPAGNVFTTGLGADGKAAIVTGKNKGDPNLTVTAIAKPETGGGGMGRGFGQGGPLGAASGLASVKEMHAAHPNLQTFEKGLIASVPTQELGALDRFRQRLANDLQTHGAITAAQATEAERELAQTNPDLLIYGRNLKQWIVSDMNVSRGATDERARMDAAVSGLSVPLASMTPAQREQYINQVWEGRQARLDGLDLAVPGMTAMLHKLGGTTEPVDHTKLSDAEFAKQYKAGAFKRPP